MTGKAWAYIYTALFVGAALSVLSLLVWPVPAGAWLPFVGLTLLATLSQLFEVEAPGRQSYYAHSAFFFAGFLLLPPSLFMPMLAVPHVIEWVKKRAMQGPNLIAWYIQPFNVAAHTVAGFTAFFSYQGFEKHPATTYSLTSVLAVTVAAVTYVAVNHAMVGLALVLARGVSWKESRVLERESLIPDFLISYLGYLVAVLVELSPWLAIPAFTPLVMVQRAFTLFRIKHDNLTDEKSGLWTFKHFNGVTGAEMDRAQRFSRYVSVIVADLDMPKELNPKSGRQAYDTVIGSLGRIFRQNIRQYDVAARLDKETFSILLPETNPFEALVVAERLRSSIDGTGFMVESSPMPIHITVSVGVACFPGDGASPADLIKAASAAAVRARSKGSNRIVCYSDIMHSPPVREPEMPQRAVPPNVASAAAKAAAAAASSGIGPSDANTRQLRAGR